MKRMILFIGLMGLAACSDPSAVNASDRNEAVEATALADYLAAINSNDLDTLMAALTDDVVYQAPHAPEIVGKDAVREWARGYLAAYRTEWKKTSLDFTVSGDWAFERYAYKSTDTDRATGAVSTDTGKGLNIYHHESDGKWRVARDAWSTDLPVTAGAAADDAKAAVRTIYEGFAAGDMARVTSVMAPDIVWREAEGSPYADKNPYTGPDAIVSDLFARLGSQWAEFTAVPQEYVAENGRVIVFGRYGGTYTASGKALDAPFVHSWTVKDGKITAFQQYTDTAQYVAVMQE